MTDPTPARSLGSPRRGVRPRRLARQLAAFGILASLLVGCVQAEIAVRVEDDGSGTTSVLFAFDESLLELMESFDESDSAEEFDPTSIFDAIDETVVPDAEVEPYRDGAFVGARITAPFDDVQDIPAMLDEITSGIALPGGEPATGGEGGAFERFVIERDGEGWRLDALVAAGPAAEGAGDDPTEDEFAAQLLEDASFTVVVVLPGELEEHNADEEVEGELTWNLDLEMTEPRTLTARTAAAGDEFPWVLAAGGGMGLVAMAGIVWDVHRRRRQRANTAAV